MQLYEIKKTSEIVPGGSIRNRGSPGIYIIVNILFILR